MRLLAQLTLIGVLFASLGQPAVGQTPFKFDPARDLEAFEDRSFSEFSDLYPLAKYEKLRGKEISPEDLTRLREEWKADLKAADARVAAVQSDPRERRLHSLRLDMSRHAFFRDVQWTEDASFAPFLLMVQIPLGAEPTYATTVVQAVGPSLQRMEALFRTTFAEPLGLRVKDPGLVYPVFILQSEIEYKDYAAKVGASVWGEGPVHYFNRWRLVVAAVAPDSEGAVPRREMRPLLRTVVKALLEVHTTTGGRGFPLWLVQGVSSYLAYRDGNLLEGPFEPTIDPEDVSQFVRASQQSDRADLLLYPIEDLAQQNAVDDVFLLVRNRAEVLGIAPPGEEDTLHFFDLQSSLWVHYLRDGRNARNRPAFDKYFLSAVDGRGGLPELTLAFKDTGGIAELDSDFVRFVTQEHKRLLPNEKLEKAPPEDLFSERDSVRAHASATDASSTEPGAAPRSLVPSSSAPFEPAVLAVTDVDFEAQHGLALIQARDGDLEGAKQKLEALALRKPAAPMDKNIARDIERIGETIRLRDGYLEFLRKSNGALSIDHRGMKFESGVAKVENGEVLLVANKAGVSKIPLRTLTPFQVARQAGTKEKQGGVEPWVRFYPYILAGDQKWEKLLKDNSEKSQELRADAASFYPTLLRTGEAAATLNALAASPQPGSPKETTKILETIRGLVAASRGLRVVEDKLVDLKRIASVLIMRNYVERDPGALAHGVYRFLGNGLSNLVYEFDKPDEAQDFFKHESYLLFWRKGLNATAKTEQESDWVVRNGDFVGVGAAAYRHFLDFTAPITLRVDLRFDAPTKDPKTSPFFMLALCDNGAGSFASCTNFSGVDVVDMRSGFRKSVPAGADPISYKHVYRFEIRHDGTNITTFVDNAKKGEAPCGERKSGAVMLWFNTDYQIAIQSLEIEGQIDPKWSDRAKADHLKTQLNELGF